MSVTIPLWGRSLPPLLTHVSDIDPLPCPHDCGYDLAACTARFMQAE